MKPRPTLRTIPARGRPPGQRDRKAGSLDSLATEFALLSQRRSRLMRQLELLERQHVAASGQLGRVESRMAVLGQRMALIPALRGKHLELVPEPPPPPPVRSRTAAGPAAAQAEPKPAPSGSAKAPPRRRMMLTY